MFEGLGKYLGQAFLIILGCVSYSDRVKINLVQPTTLYTEFQNRLPGLSRRNLQNIKICGWPREAVHHSHDEASQQSKRISVSTAESSSRRKESHGSGMDLSGSIRKMLTLHISEQIPVARDRRTMVAEPLSFRFCHGVVTEGILAGKPRSFQHVQPAT
jgi:hypothetical protein